MGFRLNVKSIALPLFLERGNLSHKIYKKNIGQKLVISLFCFFISDSLLFRNTAFSSFCLSFVQFDATSALAGSKVATTILAELGSSLSFHVNR
jgi:hypothetical protein